jgi:hypothetical protein
MAATLPRLVTSELAGIAWIGSIPGLSTQMVATTLPADDTTWAPTGFITLAVVGGSPDINLPVKRPVFQVDCWAVKPGSNKPPWWRANVIAETIRNATLRRTGINRLLAITAGGVPYPGATVLTAYLLTEPRRLYSDAADYARYAFDLAMAWTTVRDQIP